jgi:Nif-specific regulatory protein
LRVLDRRLGAGRSLLVSQEPVSQERGQEPKPGRLRIQACRGISSDDIRLQSGSGVLGRVSVNGQPIVVPVLRHDPMALSELTDPSRWHDVGWNLVAVPVMSAGRVIGGLGAYFRHRDAHGFAERLNALEVVASLIGKALRGPDAERKESHALAASAASAAERGNASHEAPPPSPFEYANMVGESPIMRQIYEQIGQVARTNATALLRGESGTGKEVVAHAIHQNSARADQPFVKVNCAALPDALFESEFFGHERGAFTGAHSRKKGRFELAQGGTLFLDEIGELSAAAQAKLLRALQFREFERVGGTETLHMDVRIIAATNLDLEEAIAGGKFREDLYYRIHVFTMTVPPLRARRTDIPQLAHYFLRKWIMEHKRNKITRIANSALDLMCEYSWPGNVRELENVIERAVVVCSGSVIHEQHLPASLRAKSSPSVRLSLSQAVEKLERQMIEEALHVASGNVAAAARALGTTERVVRYKAQKLGIEGMRPRSTR